MSTQSIPALAAAIATLALAAPAVGQDTTIQVTTAVVGTDVTDRQPVGVADTFERDVGRIYFFTTLEGDFPATNLEHVWLHEGEEIARVPIRAEGPRWRTWSSKEIAPEWTGQWEVQVVNAAGDVLGQTSFAIGDVDDGEAATTE